MSHDDQLTVAQEGTVGEVLEVVIGGGQPELGAHEGLALEDRPEWRVDGARVDVLDQGEAGRDHVGETLGGASGDGERTVWGAR